MNKRNGPADLGVYIFGRREVIIDGGALIRDYSSESVVFSSGRDTVVIYGRDLSVRVCGEGACEVTGRIGGVRYGAGTDV